MNLENRRAAPHLLLILGSMILTGAGWAGAGVWNELPESVNRLQRHAGDYTAVAIVQAAEEVVIAEAAAGRMATVAALMDVFAGLVLPLADGDRRVQELERRAAAALLVVGDSQMASDRDMAVRAWSLAAQYHPSDEVLERLRTAMLPPSDPEPGSLWTGPPDDAEMVWHPPFQFRMGCSPNDQRCERDEKFFRWVEVDGVWLQRREVTNREYRLCVEADGCSAPRSAFTFSDVDRSDEPVVGVTWWQAREYCGWAGRRLPSEAEWERVARGSEREQRFPWGNRRDRARANVLLTAGTEPSGGPMPVASFEPTGLGIYDISGNVWEWVEDSYHKNALGAPRDGSAWTSGGMGRGMRGGSWRRSIDAARVSARAWQDEDYSADDTGFRCVMNDLGDLHTTMLVIQAQFMYPIEAQPGLVFSSSWFDPADRRYLRRRSVTWLVLEGRESEGLGFAVTLLREESDDPVALNLLERVEAVLGADAKNGDVRMLAPALERYRRTLGAEPRLAGRLAGTEGTLVDLLRRAGKRALDQREYQRAQGCFDLALELKPGEFELKKLRSAAAPPSGSHRTWSGDGREMVWIPGGDFLFGAARGDHDAGPDEHPARKVHVQGFWMDVAEVSNAEYGRCVDADGCTAPAKRDAFDDPRLKDHPVVWVDWYQARAYARWAGKRLPSEVERERAARAGQLNRYPWGMVWEDGRANTRNLAGPDRWVETSPVMSFPAGGWGLHDMVGNALEWVADIYHSDYRELPEDGRPWTQETGPLSEAKRVLRGGSFMSLPPEARLSQRFHRSADNAGRTTGFRCAADGP